MTKTEVTAEMIADAVSNAAENVAVRRKIGHDCVWLTCDTVETLIVATRQSARIPSEDDVEKLRKAAHNARAWVFECWGWLMETDLDMQCPMEVDPLDIVEQIDAVLGIQSALSITEKRTTQT